MHRVFCWKAYMQHDKAVSDLMMNANHPNHLQPTFLASFAIHPGMQSPPHAESQCSTILSTVTFSGLHHSLCGTVGQFPQKALMHQHDWEL